jgi:hypothetical protein
MAKQFYAVCTIDIVDEDGVPVHTIEDQTYPMELVSSSVDPITRRQINHYELCYLFRNEEQLQLYDSLTPDGCFPLDFRISPDDFMENDACFAMERDSVCTGEFSMEQVEWIRNRLCERSFATDTGLLQAFNAQFNCDLSLHQLHSCIRANHLAGLAVNCFSARA